MDLFSAMAYLMFVLMQWGGIKRGMLDEEGEKIVLVLSWSFTSLLSYATVSGVTAFAVSRR